MIRSTGTQDIKQLKEIWKKVFKDEDIYIDGYFEHVFQPENSWCYEDSGRITAMLYTIPCKVRDLDNKIIPAYYFYALATLESYRRKGIMGNMIDIATSDIELRGCKTMFLIPANVKLIEYYRNFGFCTKYKINGYNISEEMKMQETNTIELVNLVENEWEYSNINIMFDRKVHLFYLDDLSRYPEFKLFKLLNKGKTAGYAICRNINGNIRALQYGTNDEKIAKLFLTNTKEKENAKEITIRGDGNFALLNGLIPV